MTPGEDRGASLVSLLCRERTNQDLNTTRNKVSALSKRVWNIMVILVNDIIVVINIVYRYYRYHKEPRATPLRTIIMTSAFGCSTGPQSQECSIEVLKNFLFRKSSIFSLSKVFNWLICPPFFVNSTLGLYKLFLHIPYVTMKASSNLWAKLLKFIHHLWWHHWHFSWLYHLLDCRPCDPKDDKDDQRFHSYPIRKQKGK